VTLGPGEVIKHFSAIDLATRFSLAKGHTRATANLAAGFLAHLVAQAPFPVKAIQVDGESEFMAEFEETCQRLGIGLFVLSPKSPKLNGHVERMQRTLGTSSTPSPRRQRSQSCNKASMPTLTTTTASDRTGPWVT